MSEGLWNDRRQHGEPSTGLESAPVRKGGRGREKNCLAGRGKSRGACVILGNSKRGRRNLGKGRERMLTQAGRPLIAKLNAKEKATRRGGIDSCKKLDKGKVLFGEDRGLGTAGPPNGGRSDYASGPFKRKHKALKAGKKGRSPDAPKGNPKSRWTWGAEADRISEGRLRNSFGGGKLGEQSLQEGQNFTRGGNHRKKFSTKGATSQNQYYQKVKQKKSLIQLKK